MPQALIGTVDYSRQSPLAARFGPGQAGLADPTRRRGTRMTESQARRIELLLRAQLAVSVDTLLVMNLVVILGGKGLDLKQGQLFTDKALQTKKTINMVLESL